MMTPDFLVVGSGLAGLSFAALMARAGRRVRVLEAHEYPGGFGHTFEIGGKYKFNAQLHYVWNCGEGQSVHRILKKLGLEKEVTFERYDPHGFDRMRMPGYALDIPSDPEVLKERLEKLFPFAADSCQKFVDETFATAAELDVLPNQWRTVSIALQAPRFRRVIRYRQATLQDVFDRFALPQEAQTLLALQWPDFLLPPKKLSYFAWVMLFVGYCRGAFYPTRHFEHVIDSLVQCIRRHGGEVVLRQKVTDFMENDGRIHGVVAEQVDHQGVARGEKLEHSGGHVVCNMDPLRAAEMIGLEKFSRAVRSRLFYEYSPSNFMAYCAVEGIDMRDYGFGRSNLFHTEQVDLNQAFDDMYSHGDYSKPSFAVTVPSLLTQVGGDCPAGQQIVEFLTVADYSRFLDLKISHARAYREKKQEIFDSILDVMERDYVPNFRKHLVFQMTGSPTTNERYCQSPRGNSYGSNMTPRQIGPGRLDYRSSIRGLSFCNASSGYAGFAGTIWTGCRLYERFSGDQVL